VKLALLFELLLEPLELLEPLALVELDELLQAVVNSTEEAITAPAAITCRACKIFPPRPLPPSPRGASIIVG
jgi:hypothetical protein